MRVSKVFGSLVAVALAVGAILLSSPSEAQRRDEDLVMTRCVHGELTVWGVGGWHVNDRAPWRWDRGERVYVSDREAKFSGPRCDGTVKAYVCRHDHCRGPIYVPVYPTHR